MVSRLLTLRTQVCNARLFPGRRLTSQPWLCPTASTMSHLQSKNTPRRANFWPFFAFATGALFLYYSKNQPLLCEAPVSSDNDLEGEVSGSYKFLFNYPTFKYLNSWFSDHGISIPGDPGKGLLRYDDFSMIAREPRQEHTMGFSAGDWDANGDRIPNSLTWASWGVVDGHRFGQSSPPLCAKNTDGPSTEVHIQPMLSKNFSAIISLPSFCSRPVSILTRRTVIADLFYRTVLHKTLFKRSVTPSRALIMTFSRKLLEPSLGHDLYRLRCKTLLQQSQGAPLCLLRTIPHLSMCLWRTWATAELCLVIGMLKEPGKQVNYPLTTLVRTKMRWRDYERSIPAKRT